MRLALSIQLTLAALVGLCMAAGTSSASIPISWTKICISIALCVAYIGVGVYLYMDRGISRVFYIYLGSGVILLIGLILLNIDWSSKPTAPTEPTKEKLAKLRAEIAAVKAKIASQEAEEATKQNDFDTEMKAAVLDKAKVEAAKESLALVKADLVRIRRELAALEAKEKKLEHQLSEELKQEVRERVGQKSMSPNS